MDILVLIGFILNGLITEKSLLNLNPNYKINIDKNTKDDLKIINDRKNQLKSKNQKLNTPQNKDDIDDDDSGPPLSITKLESKMKLKSIQIEEKNKELSIKSQKSNKDENDDDDDDLNDKNKTNNLQDQIVSISDI